MSNLDNIEYLPYEIENAFAGSMIANATPLSKCACSESSMVFLSETNVRVGSCTLNIDALNDDNWVVKYNLRVNGKGGGKDQEVKIESVIDHQLQTISYSELLILSDRQIQETRMDFIEESGIYQVEEKRDNNLIRKYSFKSVHGYPILFSGSLLLLEKLMIVQKELVIEDFKDQPLEYLFFEEGIIKKIYIEVAEDASSAAFDTVKVKRLDFSSKHFGEWKNVSFEKVSLSLANDKFNDNFEIRSTLFAEDWNERHVYNHILEDVELSSYYLENKATLIAHLSSYIDTNKDLKSLLSDYLKLLLHHKPEDVYDFTIKHFDESPVTEL